MIRRAWLLIWLLGGIGLGSAWAGEIAKPGKIKHVVVVWLKQAEEAGRFMALSKQLVDLPGVVDYSIGPALPDKSGSDFHLGIVVTLENRQSLYEYLNHPKHRDLIAKMRPLVERVVTYDFITR
ncbi:hypothetical protein JCM13664_07120 [Methylothermus subterraneus]